MPPSCGCVIVAVPLHCHCPCSFSSLPPNPMHHHVSPACFGRFLGLVISPQHFLQLLGSNPGFLPWMSSCPQGMWDFFHWVVPLTLKGMLSPFSLCNFYYFYYFIHSRVYLLIPDPTPGRFPALTPVLAEAFSCCVRHLSDITVDFLCVHLCVDLAHNHQGRGSDLCLSHGTCSVTVSWSICI